ncbi:tubulin binding cofactor A [Aulographum hederae CBS 113979]|uniref:Tubulin-specific chaperone A n=1 Tax=Aulographum hederae CBS 113979 TaxID=1176131 RepID=A0A6G1GU97_9PEZI|nr:tubulin binding cofactor A [Aulographum hederae CBS 113979]
MAPPSKLAVATSSVARLVKEEKSYHKELSQQEASIKKLEQGGGDENAEFQLKQERQGLEETKKVLPEVRQRIKDALAKLEEELVTAGGEADTAEVTKAKEVVAEAKTSIREAA